ncbi:hypothetical protein SAMN05877809_101325 [Rhodobacter sp. JA431]|uniref:hypothetical protein n=1 Tax=Rhodobacter sp. JA431 TaxID=570013 RepID=UPI000BD66CB2|nr:hypothetical protein [Rhodobacter sp. JA431]SOB91272.1 hypothetical protein SAMN05877809_101325 [Rhodobacter sp. JA431]
MNHVIDTQTDKRKYGLFGVEKSDITLTLIEMSPNTFGLAFNAKWSGLVSGHQASGPFQVTGNQNKIVHQGPDIRVEITDWSLDQAHRKLSMRCQIHVDLTKYGLGTVLVYDQALSGTYGAMTPQQMLAVLTQAMEQA